MQRTLVKYMNAGFGGAGLVISVAAGVCLFQGDVGGLAWLLFGGLWTIAGLGSYSRIRKFEQQDFSWFRQRHPNSCDGNGQLSCPSCQGNRIRVRGLMRHSYTREHFCEVCGRTLYYSPEG